MIRRAGFLALALLAGCSGGDDDDGGTTDTSGTIAVTVGCTAPACGGPAALKLPVHEGSCGASPIITISVPAVTLSSSSDTTQTINGLVTGDPYCVEAWLDLDASGTLNSGDAISAVGEATVNAGPTSAILFTLDALEP